MNHYFTLPQPPAASRLLFGYMALAFLFSFAVRSLLFVQASSVDTFWLNGDILPIWSADAGLYGFYAKQILAGHAYPFVSEYIPGYLIAVVVSATGCSLDAVMFWLPALLSSLVVIPILLAAHAFRLTHLGFVAALLGSIGANYYTRTHLGYMDTDTLNLFFPWLGAALWMMALERKNLLYAVAAAFALLAFRMWYHSSAAILAAMVVGLMFVLVLFFRKEKTAYEALLLASVAVAPLPYGVSAVLIAGGGMLFYLLRRNRENWGIRPYAILLAAGFAAALFVVNSGHFLERAQTYLDKPDSIAVETAHGIYRFTDVLSTVIEAQAAPIYRINPIFEGMALYLAPALLGFFMLALAYRGFLLVLPLLILGLLSGMAGIRFAMFAAPALALGYGYLSFLLARTLSDRTLWRTATITLMTSAALGLMLFNIFRLNPYLHPSGFDQNDVRALQALTAESSPGDLVLSWWDFGWPLWYYTGRNNTLLDNGRHGSDTYLVANQLLSSNSVFVANSAKYAAQTVRSGRKEVMPALAQASDVFEKFKSFSNPETAIRSESDAYFVLHRDMLPILPTLIAIADRHPKSGAPVRTREFYISELRTPFSGKEPVIQGDTFTLDLRTGTITGMDGTSTRINGVAVSENGELLAAQQYDARSPYFMIIYNKTKALYMDGSVFHSFLVQALLLDRYDPARFEKAAASPDMKIFKVL